MVNFNQISYQFECKYATLYVNVMRFSDVTDYFANKREFYISENNNPICCIDVGYGNSTLGSEFPYPTSIQMKDTLNRPLLSSTYTCNMHHPTIKE
jgi:hypothetical protein